MKQFKVTYHTHSCFQVEDDQCIFLFDWFGEQPPLLEGSKMIYVLNSHKHGDHYNDSLLQLAAQYEQIRFLWSKEIRMPRDDGRFLPMKRNAVYELDGPLPLTVETLTSTDIGVAFLLHYDDTVIYHAGDLNWWSWSGESKAWNNNMEANFKRSMQRLEGQHIDIAFVPLDPRQEERYHWGLDYFMQHTQAHCVFPMHMWGDLDTIARWKALPASAAYQQQVMDIEREGQVFQVEV